jgi:hypothetical protein
MVFPLARVQLGWIIGAGKVTLAKGGRFSARAGGLCVTSNWPDPNAQRQIEVNLESEGNHYC